MIVTLPNATEIPVALSRIDAWCREARPVKITVIEQLAMIDSGWGGVQTDGDHLLRLVYRRDSDGEDVDEVFDVSDSEASESSIWDAPAGLQEKLGYFDESMSFALRDGRLLVLMCAGKPTLDS
jgi:hypothetical protein